MPTKGGERTSPENEGEDAVGRLHRGLQRCGEAIERKASTGVDQQGEERAGFEDDGEDNKDNERTTEQRCKNRQDTPRTAKIRQEPPRYAEPDTPRYAEPAARVRYKYETCFGNNGRPGMIHMLCLPPLFYI